MLQELAAPSDGVTLARSVRAVAAQARLTLNRPAEPGEARELLRIIEALEVDARFRPSQDLSRWLASLRRRVESHGSTYA